MKTREKKTYCNFLYFDKAVDSKTEKDQKGSKGFKSDYLEQESEPI